MFGQVSLSIVDRVADYINIYQRLEFAAVIRHNASGEGWNRSDLHKMG